jgi:YVTN family beta-propeller protein
MLHPIRSGRPRTIPGARWAAAIALLLLIPAIGGVAIGVRDPSTSARAQPPVGPWDPLVGDPALGVPRYHVSTTPLAPSPHPGYVSGTPVWLAYDAADQSFWVAAVGYGDAHTGSVDVIPADAWYNVTATVPVGIDPFGVAVDNRTNEIFVTNTGSDNVSVINGSTDLPIYSIGVGAEPMGVAFDFIDDKLFVANQGSDNVSVISLAGGGGVATVPVGYSPIGVAYDPATDDVFVADSGSYAVSVLGAATDRVVATVPVGIGPYGVAVDNATDNVYVSNEGSSNVSVFQATNDTILASIPVVVPGGAQLEGLAYDGQTGQVWVGAGNSYLVLVNATAQSVAFVYTTDPAGVAYDPDTGTVCYTNTDNATFECMSPSSPTTNNVPVTFTETGLPPGTDWSVTVFDGPGLTTNGTQIVFDVCPSFTCVFGNYYRFVIPPAAGDVASVPEPNVYVSYSAVGVSVSFSSGPTEYPLDFNESGLAPGIGWTVYLNGSLEQSSGTSLSFYESKGSYNFTTGEVGNYFASPSLGTVYVRGAAASQNISFSTVTWGIYFDESGVSQGSEWYVNFTSAPPGFPLPTPASSRSNTLLFDLENGSYTYAVATSNPAYVSPSGGSLFVSGGQPYSVSIVFTAVAYTIAFQELGLPSGANWSVNLTGQVQNSTGTAMSFAEPSGTFAFTVGAVSGYRSTPGSGSVVVSGASPAPILISFTSTWTFSTIFHETGLAVGTGWSVAIGSQFQSTVTSKVTLIEPNGTYGYVIQSIAGYTTTYSGVLTVYGANQTVLVVFAAQTFPVIIVEFGLPNGTNWSVTVSNSSTGFSVTHTSNGSAIIFYLENGTYSISVSVPPGYTISLSSATFTVAGAKVAAPTVHLVTSTGTGNGFGGGSTPGITVPYWLIIGAMAVVIVLLVAFVLWSRRRPPGAALTPAA